MKLPELSEVQFQASAQSQAFDPLKLPDPNPQLQQNLSIIQQSFANLAQSGKANAQADYGMQDRSFLEQFAELVPKAVNTAIELQKTDVAIQMARADDRYYQMLEQGLIPQNGELLSIEQQEKAKDNITKAGAAEAAQQTGNYDVVRGILNFSNHGEIALRRRTAQHMFTNVYPDWMKTQLETNDSTVMVENEDGQLVEVAINQQKLPDYQHKQIMSHLRTAFMGHELLADTNNDLIQKEMAIGFKTDAAISTAYSRNTRAADGTARFNAGYTNMFNEFKEGNLEALGDFQTDAASMYDKKGVNLINTPTEFFTRLISDIGTAAENGAEFPIGEFIKNAKFADGQTFMERAPLQARLLMRTYSDKRRTYLTNKAKADRADFKFAITEQANRIINSDEETPVSDIVIMKTEALRRATELGFDPSDELKILDNLIRVGSMGADEINELREQAQIALATGTATTDSDYYRHKLVRQEYGKDIETQETRKETPEYKAGEGEISDRIKTGTKSTMVDPQGRLTSQARRAERVYTKIFDDKYAELVAQNEQLSGDKRLTESAIAAQARDTALAQWEKDSTTEGHMYYINPKNGSFPNFPEAKQEASEITQNNNVRSVADAVLSGSTGAKAPAGEAATNALSQVARQPQLVMSEVQARAALTQFHTNGTIPPSIETFQKKLNDTLGQIVIDNPMALVIAAARGHGILKPNETPQNPAFLQRAYSQEQTRAMFRAHLRGENYSPPAKYGPVAQMPTRQGMPNVAPVFQGETPEGLTGLTANDYRELGFIVSAEAGPGDDKYAVAASVINRLATGGFGDSISEIGRAAGQYEAVYTGKAYYSDELTQDLASPEGQKKIAEMLMLLDGRTDFKGQSQLGNRDPDNDPMVDPLGNFFHYAGQTGMGPYTGTVNRNYRRFLK